MYNLKRTMLRNTHILVFFVVCLVLAGTSSVRAQEIDFLIQGDTYTPPFYKGRSLWSTQTKITAVAIPRIPGVSNTSSLEYIWTKNGTVLGGPQGVNGVGRSTLTFTDQISERQIIKLEILSSEGALLTEESITISPVKTEVLVFENNPLYGFLFHNEVGQEYSMKGSEVTFAAFPLFFSAINIGASSIEYRWQSNNESLGISPETTLRSPDGIRGSSIINVKASHKDKFLQESRKNFLVEFGQR
jgi:hypothetical protein